MTRKVTHTPAAPSFAKPNAQALPMPDAAPVINANPETSILG